VRNAIQRRGRIKGCAKGKENEGERKWGERERRQGQNRAASKSASWVASGPSKGDRSLGGARGVEVVQIAEEQMGDFGLGLGSRKVGSQADKFT